MWLDRLPRPRNPRSLLGLLVRAAVAAGALGFVARGVRWRDVANSLRTASPLLLAVVVLLNALMMSIKAVRLKLLIGGRRASLHACFVALLTSSAINNVTPFRGGDVARLWMLERSTGLSKSAGVGLALVEKLLELIALAAIVLAETPLHLGQGWARVAAPVILAAASAALLGLKLSARASAPPLPVREGAPTTNGLGVGRLWARARSLAARFAPGVASLSDPGVTARAIWLSILIWGCETAMIAVCARALDVRIAFALGPFLLLALNLAIAIPAAPAGTGPFEGAMVMVLMLAGVSKDPAVAFAILYHAILVVPVTIAGLAVVLAPGVTPRAAQPFDGERQPAPCPSAGS